jgi:hypothetical protein
MALKELTNDEIVKLGLQPHTRIDNAIQSAANDTGLDPRVIKQVAIHESSLNPNAVSPTGPQGVMQLSHAAAVDSGINPDQRFNPEINISGGARYYKQQQDRFGKDRAYSAYHDGPSSVSSGKPISKEGSWMPQVKSLKELTPDQLKVLGIETPTQPAVGQQPPMTFIEGIGKPMAHAANAITQLFGNDFLGDTSEIDRKAPPTGASMAGELVGSVASGLPLILSPMTYPALAGTGAAYSALTTEGGLKNRLTAGAEGGALGVAGKYASNLLGVLGKVTQPYTEKGRDIVMGRILRNAINKGDGVSPGSVNLDDLLARLEGNNNLVKGSMPTVAEVADSGGLAALQRSAEAANPEAYAFRRAQNAAARDYSLSALAPDAGLLANKRALKTGPLYDLAKLGTIPLDDTFAGLMKRPSMKASWNKAQAIAAENGKTLPNLYDDAGNLLPDISGDNLHHLKLGLDSMISDPKNPLSAVEGAAMKGTRNAFETWREAVAPDYAVAQKAYKDASGRVNRAEIGSYLYDKAKPALSNYGGNDSMETVTQLARAIKSGDKTAVAATGRKNATLANTMTKPQLKLLDRITNDMARVRKADTLGRGPNSNTAQNLIFNDMVDSTGGFGIAGNLLSKIPGAKAVSQFANAPAELSLRQSLADAMLNPKKAAQLMRLPNERQGISGWSGKQADSLIKLLLGTSI